LEVTTYFPDFGRIIFTQNVHESNTIVELNNMCFNTEPCGKQ